jgi:predicted tellurium resistance membrane protein TerC
MMEWLSDPASWATLLTLTALEIVLGIDNIILLSILVSRLAPQRQHAARITGLSLAMLTRIALLFSIVWMTKLTQPLLQLGGFAVSGRDLILFAGGLFLLITSVLEIHETFEGAADQRRVRVLASFALIVVQIAVIDIVFSLDSVFTAVGLAKPDQLPIMVIAIVIAILVMMWVSATVSEFIDRHPTVKVLALAFLILIGMALIADSGHVEIPKGYLYFAMAFSVGVEMVNIRLRALLDARRQRDAAESGRDG